jgi:hypothetical protein
MSTRSALKVRSDAAEPGCQSILEPRDFRVAPAKGINDFAMVVGRGRILWRGSESVRICLNHFDKLLGTPGAAAVWLARGVKHVPANVVLDDFGRQAVDRAAYGDREVEDLGAASLVIDGAFQSFNLAGRASYAVEEFFLLSDGFVQAFRLCARG